MLSIVFSVNKFIIWYNSHFFSLLLVFFFIFECNIFPFLLVQKFITCSWITMLATEWVIWVFIYELIGGVADWGGFCTRNWVFHAWRIPDGFQWPCNFRQYVDIQDSFIGHHSQTVQCRSPQQRTSQGTRSLFERHVSSLH